MTKKNLLFDFNGVISYNNFWQDIYNSSHELYEKRNELNEYVFKKNIKIVKDWMVGKYTAEDIHMLIERDLGIKYDHLFPIFTKGAKEIDISKEILLQLQKIKSKNYNIILVTDNMDSFSRFTKPNNRILDETFDAIYNSYNTGLLKKDNDGEIFKKIVSDFESDLKHSYFFDDSKSNCQLFEKIGGSSTHVTGIDMVLEKLNRLI